MAKKRHYEGESRRKSEMRSAGMIHDDRQAVANMPQSVMYKPWGNSFKGFDSNLDDTISGIDRQMDRDESTAKRHNVPKKW